MRLKAFVAAIGAITLLAQVVPALAKSDGTSDAETPAPVSSEPQQTSASFGDWVVRCDRPGGTGGKRVCEAAQSLVVKGQQGPIAQIAFTRLPDAAGLFLTVLLPVNIAFGKPPSLAAPDGLAATLTVRRCVSGGCLADATLDSTLVRDLRSAPKSGRLTFTDATDRALGLPISFRGLPQALDDLVRETKN